MPKADQKVINLNTYKELIKNPNKKKEQLKKFEKEYLERLKRKKEIERIKQELMEKRKKEITNDIEIKKIKIEDEKIGNKSNEKTKEDELKERLLIAFKKLTEKEKMFYILDMERRILKKEVDI